MEASWKSLSVRKTSTGWVTFMLYSSPATTWIGTSGRYLRTTEQSSVAWKLGSPAAIRYALRMVESLNACGVWPRRSRERSGTSVMNSPSSPWVRVTMIVSAEGMATSTAW